MINTMTYDHLPEEQHPKGQHFHSRGVVHNPRPENIVRPEPPASPPEADTPIKIPSDQTSGIDIKKMGKQIFEVVSTLKVIPDDPKIDVDSLPCEAASDKFGGGMSFRDVVLMLAKTHPEKLADILDGLMKEAREKNEKQ